MSESALYLYITSRRPSRQRMLFRKASTEPFHHLNLTSRPMVHKPIAPVPKNKTQQQAQPRHQASAKGSSHHLVFTKQLSQVLPTPHWGSYSCVLRLLRELRKSAEPMGKTALLVVIIILFFFTPLLLNVPSL